MSGRRWLIAASVVAATAVLDAQDIVFSSKVEAVRVDVLVTDRDKGGAMLGLKPSDFELRDNGVLQQVDLVSFEQIPLNVVLALDMSESVSGNRLEQLREASSGLLGGLTRDDQAGLVTFTQRVVLGSKLTNDLAKIREAMTPLNDVGDTSIIDATYAAMMLGESDVGRGLVIVFSDGLDTASWHDFEVTSRPGERPRLALAGRAAARAQQLGVGGLWVSLSHSRHYAVAHVVAAAAPSHPGQEPRGPAAPGNGSTAEGPS